MGDDLISTHFTMDTNDFVNNLKSLTSLQTTNKYSDALKHLIDQFKQGTPNGLMDNKPLGLAIVQNFYRVIPIFEKKLLEKSQNSYETNAFLEALSNTFVGFCLIDLCLAIKDSQCLSFIFHTYLPFIKQIYFTNDNKYDHLMNCVLPIVSSSSLLISVHEQDLPPNLFSYLLEFTKANWQRKHRNKIINNVLALTKIFTTMPNLVPIIMHSDWPKECIQWLKTTGERPSYRTDFLINLILQKLARYTTTVEQLNQYDCIRAIMQSNKQMKKYHNEEEYSSIHFVQCITYTLLVEANDIKRKSIFNDELIRHLRDQITMFLIASAKNDVSFYKGCHLSEISFVLTKLFVNDDILIKCLSENNELLDCLCQLLIKYSRMTNPVTRFHQILGDQTLIALANLLWSISFHESYRGRLKQNQILMNTLSNLATSSLLYTSRRIETIPLDVSSLKKAAEGILWNLKFSFSIPSNEKPKQQSHVMISYSHGNSKFCRELVEHLSRHIPVWIDYREEHSNTVHSDDLWEEIAGAIETATAIVLLVSKEYYESKSCRQELSYACDTLKKRIVPVYVPDQKYKANGWLGIRIAGQKYVHFGRKTFDNAVNELLSILMIDHQLIPIENPPKEKEKSLRNWTSTDIRKWFQDNHIHNDLVTFFADRFHTGTALIVYARHLKYFYPNEYLQISNDFHKKFQTLDVIAFVDALWRLREEYDPQSKMEDTWDVYSKNQFLNVVYNTTDETTYL